MKPPRAEARRQKQTQKTLWSATLLLLAIAGPVGVSRAQTSPDVGTGLKRPLLAGHRFVGSTVTDEAFLRTAVEISAGIGDALDVRVLDDIVLSPGDTLQGLDGDIALAHLGLGYRYAIREWLEVGGELVLTGRMGTDVGAFYAEGALILSRFDFGWVFRLLERRNVFLSGDVRVASTSYTGFNVSDWIQGIVDGEQVDLVRKVPALRIGSGLRCAWAINDLYALTSSAQVGIGEAVANRRKDITTVGVGLAGEVDLLSRTSVPVGLALGVRWQNMPPDGYLDVEDVWGTNLRLAYIGRPDLHLGIDWSYSYVSLHRPSDPAAAQRLGDKAIDLLSTSATMRYYF
jgi:hypothetical protein